MRRTAEMVIQNNSIVLLDYLKGSTTVLLESFSIKDIDSSLVIKAKSIATEYANCSGDTDICKIICEAFGTITEKLNYDNRELVFSKEAESIFLIDREFGSYYLIYDFSAQENDSSLNESLSDILDYMAITYDEEDVESFSSKILKEMED